MFRNTAKYITITYVSFGLSLLKTCMGILDIDEYYEDEIFLHVIKGEIDIDSSWTSDPDLVPETSMPLSMTIWVGMVLGIFIFMSVAVCCALFCKYSGKLSSCSKEVPSPIPIIVTPPTRIDTQMNLQHIANAESGYTNQGYCNGEDSSWKNGTRTQPSYNSSPGSPTSQGPPVYLDVAVHSSKVTFPRSVGGKKLETPPPAYITVAPFQ